MRNCTIEAQDKDTQYEFTLGSCKNKSCTNIAQVTGSNPAKA